MRKILATAGILAVMSTSVFAQATASPHFPHPDADAVYMLKDGNTLYVYKDGKMAMESKTGTAVYSKRSIDAAIDDGGSDDVKAAIGDSLPNTRAEGLRSHRRFGQWGVW